MQHTSSLPYTQEELTSVRDLYGRISNAYRTTGGYYRRGRNALKNIKPPEELVKWPEIRSHDFRLFDFEDVLDSRDLLFYTTGRRAEFFRLFNEQVDKVYQQIGKLKQKILENVVIPEGWRVYLLLSINDAKVSISHREGRKYEFDLDNPQGDLRLLYSEQVPVPLNRLWRILGIGNGYNQVTRLKIIPTSVGT